ncbi:phosphoglycerol transferase I [Gallibacterium anatis CCM5995]|uniref:LTA synthase family protein n=1 Tax=Gallibacterium anatis TaxID=750 RepID=UPI0005316734|nr:LTA synthase family protein [Gallibacterium anatis]KGQ23909.1 phosphoglycerol transferase I [Gallibacterium anatis CCM5995]
MQQLKLPVKLLVFSIFLFLFFRLLFIGLYPDYFLDQISIKELLQSFLYGIRFDLNISVIFLSPILLISILPFSIIGSLRFQKVLSCFSLIVFIVFSIISLIDLSYFGEVYRHLGREIFLVNKDIGFLFDVAFKSRLLYTISGFIILGIIILSYIAFIIYPLKNSVNLNSSSIFSRSLLGISFLIFCFWLARGMIIQGRPISYADAFENTISASQANLVLNSPFVVWKQFRKQEKLGPINLLTDKEKDQISFRDDVFLFQSNEKENYKNIVFILLESWSYKYIDGLAHRNYNVTPFIDSLIKKSIVWDNYYAAGKRSIIGIQAVLSSVPALNNHPVLGFGLELNKISRIGKILNDHQYRTIMMQTSNRRSFNVNSIANVLGFQEYYGKEDVPIIKKYPQEPPHFGWDYDSLQFLLNKLNETPESKLFFAFLFTGSTHEPFADAGKEFHIYPHNQSNENGFLNTLRYSDWSLEQFMKAAEKQPWYQNTIFIFTADHTLNSLPSENLKEQFHIPLIIYSPDGSLSAKRESQFASQYDLFPTMLDLLGIDTPISTFGQSLLHPKTTAPTLFVSNGQIIGMISPAGTATFLEQKQLSISNDNDELRQQILKFKQKVTLADMMLDNNQWAK